MRLFLVLLATAGGALGQCSFAVNPSSADAVAGLSTGSFAITATRSDCPRTATSNASWLTVTFGQTGTGNGSVGYRIDANPGYTIRSGGITVGGAVFSVTQAALPCPPVAITPMGQAVQPPGGSFSITITSPCGWSASTNVSWISLSANSGTGSGVLVYGVSTNNTGSTRSGNIQIGGNTYSVLQYSIDCAFTVSPLSVSVGVAGGANQITVRTASSACPWTVQNGASWISNVNINGTPGTTSSGNGVVSYTVAANSATQPRTATLTVANETVTVSQAGNVCTFAVTPTSTNVGYGGTQGSFGVMTGLSNCPWTATSNKNWITVKSGASGMAAGTVGYSVDMNPSTLPRTGALAVNAITFTVMQDGCSNPASFSPQNQAAQAAGGNFSVGVTTACTWTASSSAPWIGLNTGSGTTGNGSLSYSVAPNNTASPRSGSIQINNQTFTVTQAGIGSSGSGIRFTAQSLVNGASFVTGPVAPGELISIFGSGLGPAQASGLQTTADGRSVTTSLGGTRVLFDGMAAPLTYVSSTQVNAIVPYEVSGAASTQVVVEVQGAASSAVAMAVSASAPAVFAVSGGTGQGAILNQDNQPNSAANPAVAGSVLQVFTTGMGQTSPTGVDGLIAGADTVSPLLKVTATIGGVEAPVMYAGSSNGLVAGVTQVNVAIPAGALRGSAVPLVLNVGGNASGAGITVAVQ